MLGAFLGSDHYAALLRGARTSSQHWLQFDSSVLQHDYNRRAFALSHRLPDHPGFGLDALHALCRRLPQGNVMRRVGSVPKDTHFDSSLDRYREEIGIDQAFAELEERKLYIAIYNAEDDPEYRHILEGLLGEIALATDPFEHRINWYSTYIFVSAGGSLTPYHMDREMNFLLQVRGTKRALLWNANDDAVMTAAQRDRLFSFAPDSRPTYRPELEPLAREFTLLPGIGVHHPFIAPHLVYTGAELSISLAITFRSPRSDRWSDAHAFNDRCRRTIGLAPGRVGRFAPLDSAKSLAMRLARRLKRGTAG
jgi:hypothetical protein